MLLLGVVVGSGGGGGGQVDALSLHATCSQFNLQVSQSDVDDSRRRRPGVIAAAAS